MKKYLLPFALFPLLMISCSKELSLDNGETPQFTSDLLVKVVYNYGDDSSQVEYTYNAAKQLIGQRYSGMVQGVTIESESRFIRDAAGLATKVIRKDPNLVAGGIDSIVTVLNYDITASRYTSRVTRIESSGILFIDSVNLVYNTSGRLIREDAFIASVALGNVYIPRAKTEYTWDLGGNVSQIDYSESDISTGSPMQLLYTLKYAHDTRKSALQLTNRDAYGIGLVDLAGPNNVIKEDFLDLESSDNNYNMVYSFVYNSKNKPGTGVITLDPGGGTTGLRYEYRDF